MTDLLLITDMPRLADAFDRLADNKKIRLRKAASLEQAVKELAIEKPAAIFIQNHLSGFSADILLLHLKKQLGRKRSRFILLSTPDQVHQDTAKLFHGQVDISLDPDHLFESLSVELAEILSKKKATSAENSASRTKLAAPQNLLPDLPLDLPEQQESIPAVPPPDIPKHEELPPVIETHLETPLEILPTPDVPSVIPHITEPTLEEQGITYSPRSSLKVYSEFSTSFDSAVSSTPPAETLDESSRLKSHVWLHDEVEAAEVRSSEPSKRAVFLLWLIPVVLIVVAVTVFQHRNSTKTSPQPLAKDVDKSLISPNKNKKDSSTPAISQKPKTSMPEAEKAQQSRPDSRVDDAGVISAIAENRAGQKNKGVAGPVNLPDFIPRDGFDKAYSIANPRWERYKGRVTEFKVCREAGNSIKAIQVIDRGGDGIPETFMKGVVKQVAKQPSFAVESSEKKEGYSIQRGKVSGNLKIVYYRDADSGRLRAFAMTWE